MQFGHDNELIVGNNTYKVTTDLRAGDVPFIETTVSCADETLFREATEVADLRPLSEYRQEVLQRIASQHQRIFEQIKKGELIGPGKEDPMMTSIDDRLSHVVSCLASGDLESAESALRQLLSEDTQLAEARELYDVAERMRSGTQIAGNVVDDFKSGAEAFAAGKGGRAIELWKGCLASEPSKRSFQLVMLLASTRSADRRKAWTQEILALGSRILAQGETAEAYALLLVAQSAEQQPSTRSRAPTGPVPPAVLENTSDTQPPDVYASALDSDATEIVDLSPPVEAASVSAPLPSDTSPSAESTTTPSVNEDDYFQTPNVGEREAAFHDAGEAEVGQETDPDESHEKADARAKKVPRRSSVDSSVFLYVGAGAIVLIAVTALVWYLLQGETIPVEELEAAGSLLNTGQYAQAVDAYSTILATHGDVAPAFLGRGRAQLANGNIDAGLSDLVRAVELDPDAGEVTEELAEVLYTQGRFDEAIGYYQQALKSGDVSAESLYRLGMSLVQLEQFEEALPHLKSALAKNPSHGEARLLYGTLLNTRRRYAEAEQVLRQLEAGSDGYLELGIALLEQGKLEEAEEVTRSLLNQAPGDERPLTLIGEIYLERRQFEAARRELIRALRINPQEPRAQIALGRTWLAIGEQRQDQSALTKARQILANARGVHEGERLLTLGEVSLAEGNTETALSLMEEALASDADPLAARFALAEARYVAKDLPGSARELQHAEGLAPADPAITLSLGVVYSELKDARRASEEYLKTIQGIGMTTPATGNGPVVLPTPHIPLPARYNINQAIRAAYRQVLSESEEDPTAVTLKELAESTSFVISGN
jgi:tetratricopeptide (TPR) repeat protein